MAGIGIPIGLGGQVWQVKQEWCLKMKGKEEDRGRVVQVGVGQAYEMLWPQVGRVYEMEGDRLGRGGKARGY